MTLRDFLLLMRRHLPCIIVFVVLAVGVAYALSLALMPNTYEARSSVWVTRDGAEENTATAVVMSLGGEDAFLTSVQGDHDGYDVDVNNQTGTALVLVTVTGPSAEGVAGYADAVAAALCAHEFDDGIAASPAQAAEIPTTTIGPKRAYVAVVAGMACLAVVVCVIVWRELDRRPAEVLGRHFERSVTS